MPQPDELEEWVTEYADILRRAHNELEATIQKKAQKVDQIWQLTEFSGMDPASDEYKKQTNKLRRIELQIERQLAQQEDIRKAKLQIQSGSKLWLDDKVPRAYEMGALDTGLVRAFSFTQFNRRAVDEIIEFHYEEILGATTHMDDAVKEFTRNAMRMFMERTATQGMTRVQAGREFAALLTRQEITAVTYADGSKHTIEEYGTMLARTTTALTYNRGALGQMEELDVQWCEVFDGADCGATSHDDPDKVNGTIRARRWCEKNQIAHPNCRRSFGARPDIEGDGRWPNFDLDSGQPFEGVPASEADPFLDPEVAKRQAEAERKQYEQKAAKRKRRKAREARAERKAREARKARTQKAVERGVLPTIPAPEDAEQLHDALQVSDSSLNVVQIEESVGPAMTPQDQRVWLRRNGFITPEQFETMTETDIRLMWTDDFIGEFVDAGAKPTDAMLKHATMRNLQSRIPVEVQDRLVEMMDPFGDQRGRYVTGMSYVGGTGTAIWDATKGRPNLIYEGDRPTGDPNEGHEWGSSMYQSATDVGNDDQVMRNWAISQMVRQWAISSNGKNPLSLALQEAARREFVMPQAAPWDMMRLSSTLRYEYDRYLDDHGEDLQAFVRGMYDETQSQLRGWATITVARGFTTGGFRDENNQPTDLPWVGDRVERDTIPATSGREMDAAIGRVDFTLRPMSSFATEMDQATAFGRTVIYGDVPVERVIGFPGTGFGCAGEHEVVLLCGNPDEPGGERWWTARLWDEYQQYAGNPAV